MFVGLGYCEDTLEKYGVNGGTVIVKVLRNLKLPRFC